MNKPDDLHRDRARAESFGAVAEDYERYRPPYAEALWRDLAALGTRRAVDVGCGTGKVAVALAARGHSVIGVESDSRMADVARRRGVEVEVARFEDWDDRGRTFDLVACGSAWHWIEPHAGAARAAKVLEPGGWLVRVFAFDVLEPPALARLDAVYAEHAPDAWVQGHRPDAGAHWVDAVATHEAFDGVETRAYEVEREIDAAEWAGFLATVSDHQRLGPARLATLQAAVREALASLGPLRVLGVTHALYSRAAPSRRR